MSIIAFPKHRVRSRALTALQADPLDYPNEGEIYLLPTPIERRAPNALELWHLTILFWASVFRVWAI